MNCARLSAFLLPLSISSVWSQIDTSLRIKFQATAGVALADRDIFKGFYFHLYDNRLLTADFRYHINDRWMMEAQAVSPLVMAQDAVERELEATYLKPALRYNQTSLVAAYTLRETKTTIKRCGRDYFRRSRLAARGGYYYYQQSTEQTFSGEQGYYIMERGTDDGYLHRLNGITGHCLVAGIDLYTTRFNKKERVGWNHHAYLDLLIGVAFGTKGLAIDDYENQINNSYYAYEPEFPVYDYKFSRNFFDKQRFGGRIAYEVTKTIASNWGITAGCSMAWRPGIKIDPIDDGFIYAPRGITPTYPYAASLQIKLAVSYVKVKKG